MFATKEQLAAVKVKPSVRLWQINGGEYQTLLMDKNLLFIEEEHGFDEDYFWKEVREELKTATGALELINGFLFCNFAKNEYVYVTGDKWDERVQNHLIENGAITVVSPKAKTFDLTSSSASSNSSKPANKSSKYKRPGARKKSKRK
ncbi:hypothetical protein [Moorena sp. SIO3I8]|uniref:hypothetical protein n=1 Tax=Moorena sp. SIO3I8 TaxID=2607833 RepID=UPI0013C0CDA0|nr:hypothetical protein [Moorena sp. SIO3I8]NEO08449.1 hypothetical protein [Moorena sp. SIO3I8]